MKKKKIVFMGTPEFAVPILEGLIENYHVVGVVSQPDKKIGRKQILSPTPVKICAINHQIKVLQPQDIKKDYQEIINLNPDIIITCAYGQIISKELLDYPKYGCINVHASLLPKLRGGAPIHKAILQGHNKTGITIMYMDVKMDSGDIISQVKTTIEEDDCLQTLQEKLSQLGKKHLLEVLPSIFNGINKRIKQNEEEVTYAYNIKREEEHIDFSKSSRDIYNRIRGLSKTPGAYAMLDSQVMKIYKSRFGEKEYQGKKDGEIVAIYKDGIGIKTKDGEIIITEIKPFGKKEMKVKDYLNGIKKEELIGKIFY